MYLKSLDVPLIRQGINTPDCGPASLAMVLQYYGFDTTVEDINMDLNRDGSDGMTTPAVANYLLEKFLDVEIVTFDPRLFTKRDSNLSNTGLLRSIENAKDDIFTNLEIRMLNDPINYTPTKIEKDKIESLNEMKQFVELGGDFELKVPRLEDILPHIANGNPVITSISSRFLNDINPGYNGHFNVITGFDDKYLYSCDPMWDHRGGKKKYLFHDYLYASHIMSVRDLFGCAIIKPRENLLNYR